jgi:hypothetical protein
MSELPANFESGEPFTAADEDNVETAINNVYAVDGLIKSNGETVSAAVAGVDYLGPAFTIASPVTVSGTAETVIASLPIPANSVSAGTTFRITGFCVQNATAGSPTFQVRLGTTGTVSDTEVTLWFADSLSSGGILLQALVTIEAIGSSGTAIGNGAATQSFTAIASDTTTAVPVNTTVENFLTLTGLETAGAITVTNLVMERV